MSRKVQKMLYVGDFPVPTGFGVVSKNLVSHFKKHYDMHIIGINYYGDYDPEIEGLKVYPASAGNGDVFGVDKFFQILQQVRPDVCFILNDVWIGMEYGAKIKEFKTDNPEAKTMFVLYTPIDAENIKPMFVEGISPYDKVITYTNFGKTQLELGGYKGKIDVVPHGVDTSVFKPMDKKEVRKAMNIGVDDYIVLNVSRNQPRKKLDLFFFIFSEWVKRYNLPPNVRCYYHGALRDVGIDIMQWVEYLGIQDRLVISNPNLTANRGLSEQSMNMVYNSADVFFTTTAAEGWGLPIAEAMSTGVPAILPNHSALPEWTAGKAQFVPVYPFPSLADRGLNTIHHIINVDEAVKSLQFMYANEEARKNLGRDSYKHMTRGEFNWKNIAARFMEIFKNG
jgi:glycosyltransferase involved in cell wall biosynthesis